MKQKTIFTLHDYTNEKTLAMMGLRIMTIPEKVAAKWAMITYLRKRARIENAMKKAIASIVTTINEHGDEIYKQYVSGPPLKAGFDWSM